MKKRKGCKEKMVRITIRISKCLHDKLRVLAARKHISMSELVRRILKKVVEEEIPE